jgi:hypothetical protein
MAGAIRPSLFGSNPEKISYGPPLLDAAPGLA